MSNIVAHFSSMTAHRIHLLSHCDSPISFNQSEIGRNAQSTSRRMSICLFSGCARFSTRKKLANSVEVNDDLCVVVTKLIRVYWYGFSGQLSRATERYSSMGKQFTTNFRPIRSEIESAHFDESKRHGKKIHFFFRHTKSKYVFIDFRTAFINCIWFACTFAWCFLAIAARHNQRNLQHIQWTTHLFGIRRTRCAPGIAHRRTRKHKCKYTSNVKWKNQSPSSSEPIRPLINFPPHESSFQSRFTLASGACLWRWSNANGSWHLPKRASFTLHTHYINYNPPRQSELLKVFANTNAGEKSIDCACVKFFFNSILFICAQCL